MGQHQSQPAAEPPRTGTLRRMSDVVQNTFKRSRLGSFAGVSSATPMGAQPPAQVQPQQAQQRAEEPIYTAVTAEPPESISIDEWESFEDAPEYADPQPSGAPEAPHETPDEAPQEAPDDAPEEAPRVRRWRSLDSWRSGHNEEDAHPLAEVEELSHLSMVRRMLVMAAAMAAADGEEERGLVGFFEELFSLGTASRSLIRTYSFPAPPGQTPLVMVLVGERSAGDSWRVLIIGSVFPAVHPVARALDDIAILEDLLMAQGVLQPVVTQQHLDELGGLRAARGTEDRCAICLQDCEEGDDVRELGCKHGYHRECIDKWVVKGHNSCPICRQRVVDVEAQPSPRGRPRPSSLYTIDTEDVDLADVW